MRYQDWDVLLYPRDCEVPFKEFRTTPYAVQDASTGGFAPGTNVNATPLLTCFTTAIQEGSPFTISIHSWVPPTHIGLLTSPTLGDRAQWQIKITIDGVTISLFHFPADCSWPQVIAQPRVAVPGIDSSAHPRLAWPKFHKSSISSREWNASDSAGRIKIELLAGINDHLGGKSVFTKVETVVCFSFFPVPSDHLERCSISWPNSAMYENPLLSKKHAANTASGLMFSGIDGGFHKRNYSNGSANNLSSPLHVMPQPPPPSPAWGLYNFRGLQLPYDAQPMLDARGASMAASAATSEHITHAYGSLPSTASASAPGSMPLPPINNYAQAMNPHLQVRLPSDQLQKLISALKTPNQHETQHPSHMQAMPPPPLPPHALAARGGLVGQDTVPNVDHGQQYTASGTAIRNPGPRDESQGSDVSMHTACTYFPNCTTEDDTSHVVHGSPATPSTATIGKMEGSSPAKPRDFMSTILGPQDTEAPTFAAAEKPSTLLSSSPAETPGRKRTRAALRAMSLNDGSPEKSELSARKPVRKASRASSSGGAKKPALVSEEDKENQMAIDA
ncbi:hypothetical protein Q7P37_004301 [Cladosporium fusiforme]